MQAALKLWCAGGSRHRPGSCKSPYQFPSLLRSVPHERNERRSQSGEQGFGVARVVFVSCLICIGLWTGLNAFRSCNSNISLPSLQTTRHHTRWNAMNGECQRRVRTGHSATIHSVYSTGPGKRRSANTLRKRRRVLPCPHFRSLEVFQWGSYERRHYATFATRPAIRKEGIKKKSGFFF